MSVRRQCELLGLNRSSLYYEPAAESAENLALMRLIDEQYTARPFYGSRRMTAWSAAGRPRGEPQAGAAADAGDGVGGHLPQAAKSVAGRGHKVYPYLLRDVAVERANQVWSADITYLPMPSGFMYLAATIDWFSRYVVAWRLSNTLDGAFCQEMLEEALARGSRRCSTPTRGCSSRPRAWTGGWSRPGWR